MTTSRDRRDFTEEEYKRELGLHHVAIAKGESAGSVYRRQGAEVTGKPKSGVFRDFVEYGVHPVRVIVQKYRISIPFLVSLLSADQLAREITNQKQRTAKKKDDEKYDEDQEAQRRGVVLQSDGHVRLPPSLDAAFELITVLQKRKSFVGWTPAMQHYMSALNFYHFRMGGPDTIRMKFLTPDPQRAVIELTHLIPEKVLQKELEQRTLKDPGQWGSLAADKPTTTDIVQLIAELMLTTPYSINIREIVNWYKLAYAKQQLIILLLRVLDQQVSMITTLRPHSSLRDATRS
jgi:hypothetical protein